MKTINILLFLSDYKKIYSEDKEKVVQEATYTVEGSEATFIGVQTNDVPIQYMFKQAKESGGCIKRVICIVSYKVLKEPENEPQLVKFKNYVNELNKQYQEENEISYIEIPYDYDEETKEKVDYGKQLPEVIYSKLLSCFETIEENEEVYIDYTGGLRDISFLMTSIVRFLEFKGLRCGEIVYSNLFNKKLYDIHYIYDIYQIINGVNEFVNTGNARELSKIYNKIGGNDPARKLIGDIMNFSNALSICDIRNLDDKVNELLNDIAILELDDAKDIYSAMLKTLAPIIKEKMYLQEGLNYPKMIKWCVENNMIQQAATIYTDKMPIYYFDNELVPDYVKLEEILEKPGHSKCDTGFYTELFDRAAEGIEVAEFRKSLNELCIKPSEVNKTDSIISIISEERKKFKNKNNPNKIYSAYGNVISFIKKYCNEDMSLKEECGETIYHILKYEPGHEDADLDGYVPTLGEIKDFQKFWGLLVSGTDNSLQHRFLYNDEKDYLAIKTPPRRGTEKTYRKKIYGIKKILDEKIHLNKKYDRTKTCKIMAYYVAVKIMRNRMNHAGEDERTIDEKIAIDELNGMDMGIDFRDDIESYKRILIDGVNA